MNSAKLFIVLLFCVIFFHSCRRIDLHPPQININRTESFFIANKPVNKAISLIIEKLKKENERTDFVGKLNDKYGHPVWDKIIIFKKKENILALDTSENIENLIIPISINDKDLSSVLLAEDNGSGGYIIKDYTSNDYLFKKIHESGTDPQKGMELLTLFFYVENKTFEATEFINIPYKYFSQSSFLDSNGNKKVILQTFSESFDNQTKAVTICVTYVCPVCLGNDPDCPFGGTWDVCTTLFGDHDPIGGGISPPPPPVGGGGGVPSPPNNENCKENWYSKNELSCVGGWGNVERPGDKLCPSSFNFKISSDNSFYETLLKGLKFENAEGVNSFEAYFNMGNDISDIAMNRLINPSPFLEGLPPMTAIQYIEDVFPELMQNGDVKLVNINGTPYWRFTKYACQRIANYCANVAGLYVSQAMPVVCAVPGNVVAQERFRTQCADLLKCFNPVAVCRRVPSASSNFSYASYSPLCSGL